MCPSKETALPLRPHHGMCLAYFQGYGYSGAFTRHTGEVLERLLENVPVRLTVSTDEVCSACPNNVSGRCTSAEKVAHHDRAVLEACGLEEGAELPLYDFARTVQERIFASGRREAICGGCQWQELCQGTSRWETLEK